MKRPVFLVSALLVVASVAACEPATPAPKSATATPTSQVTSQPVSQATPQPTVNARATEAVIISHIFATMTASAPQAPAATATPTRRLVVSTPQAKATPKTTAPTGPANPPPTSDPYQAQIPKGMGGILIANYIGNRDATFTISDKAYTVTPNAKTLVVIAPGRYNFSLNVPGVAEASRSDIVEVVADHYTTYSVTLPQ